MNLNAIQPVASLPLPTIQQVKVEAPHKIAPIAAVATNNATTDTLGRNINLFA